MIMDKTALLLETHFVLFCDVRDRNLTSQSVIARAVDRAPVGSRHVGAPDRQLLAHPLFRRALIDLLSILVAPLCVPAHEREEGGGLSHVARPPGETSSLIYMSFSEDQLHCSRFVHKPCASLVSSPDAA